MSLQFVPMLRRVMVNGEEKTAAPATVTRMVYDEESGKTLDALLQNMGVGAGLALEKLWENSAPTAEFAAQTVSLNLSQYELFLVTAMEQNTSEGTYRELSFLAFKDVLSVMQGAFVGGVGAGTNARPFQILENGVNFSDAKHSYNNQNNTVFNQVLIPHRIYGIKTSAASGTDNSITWDDIYPVGSYYYSGDAEFDPNTAFGGTWEKVAENLALRQASSEHAVGSAFGEAEHVLTVDEIPSHSHVVPYTVEGGSSAGVGYKVGKSEAQSWHQTRTTGGGQAHNNIGPSLAVNIWHKTANGGKVVGQNGGGFSYSTEEQWTGEYWIDGKKIYRKVLTGNENGATSANISVPEVDTMIEMSGLISDSPDTNPGLPINAYGNSSLYAFTFFSRGANRITISVSNWKIYKYNLLVKYTKTTE